MRPAAYLPVDISQAALRGAAERLAREFPWLEIVPVNGDFSRPVELPRARARRVVYFPGSTIGNHSPEEAHAFLSMTRGQAARMLVGVDLRKDANALHAAYNDSRRVTAAFNLNLLARINRELDGDFDLASFSHHAFYNADRRRIEMHLASKKRQKVRVAGRVFEFRAGETIHTENSYKYTLDSFAALARGSGWEPISAWTDAGANFSIHALVFEDR